MAVEQDGLDLLTVEHGAHAGKVRGRAVVRRFGDQITAQALGVAMENLLGNVALKNVVKVLGRCAVHRAEMLRVHQVIDQLAWLGVDDQFVHVPAVQPLVTVHLGQVRDHHVFGGRLAFGVVPHEQQLVDFTGLPGAGFGFGRDALAVRDFHALAAGVVLPMMERADDAVVLNRALGQVRAHVRAVRVEHADHP